MTMPLRALLALALLASLAGAQTPAPSPSSLDRQVRAAYAAVEKARSEMAGEMDDKVRRERMENYRRVCRDFVQKYEGRSEQLIQGRFDLARAYIDLQDTGKAARHLERFLEQAPTHADADQARLFLGDCYRSLSRLDEATSLYQTFIASSKNAELLPFARLGLATSHYLSLKFEEAVTAYREVMARHADHQVGADAAFQLTDALAQAGRYDEARAHIEKLLAEAKEAPELEARRETLKLLGRPAPELVKVPKWVGREASTIARNKGRVVVLCFFMNNNIPSAQMLQFLSEFRTSMSGRPITVWGVTKAYKAERHPDWTFETEARWLQRFRSNPAFVLRRELRASPTGQQEDRFWKELETPITIPFAMTKDFSNHRAFGVRGVPCVVVIDKEGKVRMVEQGGQPVGGFQTRLLSRQIQRFAAE
jgi:tetratricopeptide (TPR) repeat protein